MGPNMKVFQELGHVPSRSSRLISKALMGCVTSRWKMTRLIEPIAIYSILFPQD